MKSRGTTQPPNQTLSVRATLRATAGRICTLITTFHPRRPAAC